MISFKVLKIAFALIILKKKKKKLGKQNETFNWLDNYQ